MRRKEWQFRAHLALLACLAAVPFAIAIIFTSVHYVRSAREATERQALIAARDISNAVDLVLNEGVSALRTLSTSEAVNQGDFERFYYQAKQVLQYFPSSEIALRRGSDGQQYVNTAVPWNSQLPKTSDPTLRSADEQALSSRRPVVTGLYRGASTNRTFVIVQIPVTIKSEDYLLNLAIPPRSILRVVENTRASEAFWLVSIVDKSHRVIARTRDHDQFVGRTANKDFSEQITAEAGTFFSTTLDGTYVFDAYATSSLSGWITVAVIPAVEFTAPIRRATLLTVLAFAVGLVSAIFLALVYSRHITSKIHALRDNASLLGQRHAIESLKTGVQELTEVADALSDASVLLLRDEKAKKALIDELNHRVKNSLVTVQSLAEQTSRETTTRDQFKTVFTGRLIALSRAHNALSRTDWVDADLATICNSVCPAGSVAFSGPPVSLRPRAALTLGMVIHELYTNACKHGALSAPEGHIEATWNTGDERTLRFIWREFSSKPIQPPAQLNFGMRYIHDSVKHELKGAVSMDFQPKGLVVVIDIPDSSLSVASATPL